MVLLRVKPDADSEHLMSQLANLRNLIPGIESYSGGANTSTEGRSQGYTHAFQMLFDSELSRDAYLPHPEHLKVCVHVYVIQLAIYIFYHLDAKA